MADAFFQPDGGLYLPSDLTRGPWDPGSQHAGPPTALIAREVERLESEAPRPSVVVSPRGVAPMKPVTT